MGGRGKRGSGAGPGDVDALAFDPDDVRNPRSKHFIPREGSRKRGLEIGFDPERHKYARCWGWAVHRLQSTALRKLRGHEGPAVLYHHSARNRFGV
jgi:hypothetical protein